ncbi:PREDICTED: prothrombin-like, partial [Polistes dominula]|uniref:Prothrombin-like n=1 Tax=Polistes dominula TaxID=743375 RepID=A0ABM1JB36_POLDO
KTRNRPKEFICRATIIKENLILTAAHCVYDEVNRRTQNLHKYYVVTGYMFYVSYDSVPHNKQFVTKSNKVNKSKKHINKRYLGLKGNLTADIAISEIETPFVFSDFLLLICLDDTFIDNALEKNEEFDRGVSGQDRLYLQHASFPYVPLNQ